MRVASRRGATVLLSQLPLMSRASRLVLATTTFLCGRGHFSSLAWHANSWKALIAMNLGKGDAGSVQA